jgi:hypothetical protein
MLDCLSGLRCDALDIVAWLQQWVAMGAPAQSLCHPEQLGTQVCATASAHAHALAYLLGLLTN